MKKIAQQTGWLLLLIVLLFLVLELLLRTALFPVNLPFGVRERTNLRKTYIKGFKSLIPDQTVYKADRSNGTVEKEFIKYLVNRWGFRGENFPKRKKKDEVRIVVIGGSHIFDVNAYVHDGFNGFTEIVSDSFRVHGIDVNFINAGVPGQDMRNIVTRLNKEIPEFKPDIVIVNSEYNDLRWIPADDTVPLIARVTKLWYVSNPISDTLGLNPIYNRIFAADLYFGASNLYRRVRDIFWLYRVHSWERDYKQLMDKRISPARRKSGFEDYAALLTESVGLIRGMGAIPVLCIEERLMAPDPTGEMLKVHTPEWFPYESTYMTLVNDYLKADSIVMAVSKSANTPLFNVNRYIGGDKRMFNDNIHTSQAGSRMMGSYYYQLLYPVVRDSLLPANGP